MLNFKKDRVLLLKTLRNLLTEEMDNSSINPFLEQDVSEFLTEITDKRRARRLKMIRRELDEFIAEMVSQNKLREQERLFNESRMKQVSEYHTTHCNADQ